MGTLSGKTLLRRDFALVAGKLKLVSVAGW